MPTIFVHMLAGRTLDEKRALVKGITNGVVEALNVKPEVVQIHLMEKPKEHLARGGVLRIDEK